MTPSARGQPGKWFLSHTERGGGGPVRTKTTAAVTTIAAVTAAAIQIHFLRTGPIVRGPPQFGDVPN